MIKTRRAFLQFLSIAPAATCLISAVVKRETTYYGGSVGGSMSDSVDWRKEFAREYDRPTNYPRVVDHVRSECHSASDWLA